MKLNFVYVVKYTGNKIKKIDSLERGNDNSGKTEEETGRVQQNNSKEKEDWKEKKIHGNWGQEIRKNPVRIAWKDRKHEEGDLECFS